jgi:hypothetical protein
VTDVGFIILKGKQGLKEHLEWVVSKQQGGGQFVETQKGDRYSFNL